MGRLRRHSRTLSRADRGRSGHGKAGQGIISAGDSRRARSADHQNRPSGQRKSCSRGFVRCKWAAFGCLRFAMFSASLSLCRSAGQSKQTFHNFRASR